MSVNWLICHEEEYCVVKTGLKNFWKKINKALLLSIICATISSSWCPPRSDVLLHLKLLNFSAAMAMSGKVADGFILCSALFSCFGIPSQRDPGLAILKWQSFLTPSPWLFCYLRGFLTCGLAAIKSHTQEKTRNVPKLTSHKSTLKLFEAADHPGRPHRGKGFSLVSHRHTVTMTEPFASPLPCKAPENKWRITVWAHSDYPVSLM